MLIDEGCICLQELRGEFLSQSLVSGESHPCPEKDKKWINDKIVKHGERFAHLANLQDAVSANRKGKGLNICCALELWCLTQPTPLTG